MVAPLKLIIFDVDGTLVDSQADIVAAMTYAFAQAGRAAPSRRAILGHVGLALDVILEKLAGDLPEATRAQMVDWYKDAYFGLREGKGTAASSPFYPQVREVLEALHAVPHYLLGIATGKSRRGLDRLLDDHALRPLFVTHQAGDLYPSKPHPAMLEACLSETGLGPADAVMIGDTSFDMEMAATIGMRRIGVSWGYHRRDALREAEHILEEMGELPAVLDTIWGEPR